MTTDNPRLPVGAKRLVAFVIGLTAAALLAFGGSPQKASAYWVCPTAGVHDRPAFFTCAHGTYRPTIAYIEKDSWQRAYAVYRSASPGGGPISGSMFYSPSTNYFAQLFHCNAGYPNAYNRHSVTVRVQFTLAGSC